MKKKLVLPSGKIVAVTGVWVFIILFGVLINRAMPIVDTVALKYYTEGSFRHSIEVLSAKPALNGLETYLLARDYQELNQWEKALETFRKVKLADLSSGGLKDVFLDNYGYYFSLAVYTAMINRYTNTNSLDADIVSNVRSRIGTNSFAYDTVTGMVCCQKWLAGDYAFLTNETSYKRTNQITRMFRAASRFITGDKAGLPGVFDSRSVKYQTFVLRDLTNRISREDFLSFDMNQLANAFQYYLEAGSYREADELLRLHFFVSGDRDYLIRNRATLLFRQGKRGEAVNLLTELYGSGKAGEGSLSLLVGLLFRMENYTAAYTLLKTVTKKNASYADELAMAMGKLGKFDELYDWYSGKGADTAFPSERIQDVFNLMMQKGESYARKMAARASEEGGDRFLVFAKALFELKDGKTNESYRDFLDVTLNSPFTYEWVVAKNYEREWRTNFPAVYAEGLSNSLSLNQKRSVQDKAAWYLMIREVDPEFSGRIAKDPEYRNALSNVRTAVETAMTNVSREFSDKLERARGLAKGWAGGFNREMLNLIDRDPDSSNDRYKLVYLYQKWLEETGNEGIVVYRLNYYLTKILGSRKYHPLLRDEVMRSLYPERELEVIGTSVSNEDSAYWILSAFREESHFNKDAISSSGAVGLSQLMPKTANAIKQNLRHEEWDIYDYRDNIAIGVYHFNYLFKRYREDVYRALAAYNAGETAVNRWTRQYQQPRELWLECVEFDETRYYVKKIVLTRYFYGRLKDAR